MTKDNLTSLKVGLYCVGCGRLVWVPSESITRAECVGCEAVRVAGELETGIAEATLLNGRQS